MASMIPIGSHDDCLRVIKNSETVEVAVVPKEVFLAFKHFLSENKPSGSVTIHFKNGGICGVEALTKQTYK